MKPLHMPALGVGQEEGTLLQWLKEVGEPVEAGEPLAEIETDKSAMDLESPADGWLAAQLVEPGAVVPVGTVLGEIREEGDALVAPSAVDALGSVEAADPIVPKASADAAAPPGPPVRPAPESGDAGRGRQPHALSPRQRRLALERAAAGDGAAGAADRGAPWAAGRHRDAIARQVAQAWREIPHFAVVREVRAGALVAALVDLRSVEPRATLTDLLLAALASAFRKEGVGGAVPLGLAVATPDGVMVPVIPDATGEARDITAQRVAAVDRARAGRLSGADLMPAPLATLSNLGAYGVDAFTGVIASGQAALLTVGRVALRPVVGADGAVIAAETMVATLNVDHRVLDGDVAARILAAFAAACEQPAPA